MSCRSWLRSNFSRQALGDRDECLLFGDQFDEGTAANRPTADGLNPRQQPSERPVESAASYLPVADQTATGGFGRLCRYLDYVELPATRFREAVTMGLAGG